MEQNNKNKIIYSLRVAQELIKRGFTPVKIMPNALKPQLKCWMFEWTEEFDAVMSEVLTSIGGGQDNGS